MGGGIVPSLPLPRGTQPLLVRGSVPTNNTLVLTAGNSRTTIWLSPEMVDFKVRVNITVGGRRPSGVPAMIKPSVETMLEDLRVRGDRQHPSGRKWKHGRFVLTFRVNVVPHAGANLRGG